MKPEYEIEKIREFVNMGYRSVTARHVKAALQHYDNSEKQKAELLEVIQKAIKISDLWTFDKDVTIEHEDEAKALHSMHLEFDRVIKKYAIE